MSKLKDLEHDELVFLCEKVARAHAIVVKPKKMQFSKKICVYGMMLVTGTIACNVLLSLLNCATLSDVTMTVVTTFGGFATGGYFALSGVRDCSKNKHQANAGRLSAERDEFVSEYADQLDTCDSEEGSGSACEGGSKYI